MALPWLMMAAQAAGTISSISSKRNAWKLQKSAQEHEQSQFDLRLQQEELASTQQALFSLEKLSQTLASQRVLFAARGVSSGAGSAAAIERGSIRGHSYDKKAREFNTMFRKSEILSARTMSKVEHQGKKPDWFGEALKFGMQQGKTSGFFGGGEAVDDDAFQGGFTGRGSR